MGIDYGHGLTNIDHRTDIRYGVLAPSLVPDTMLEDAEAVYENFEFECPYCRYTITDEVGEVCECPGCFADVHGARVRAWENTEPTAWVLQCEGVEMRRGSDLDWWVFKSPYAVRCDFCSPCAPGAGYVNGKGHDTFAYCPPPDWFSAETLAAMENKPMLIKEAQAVMKINEHNKAAKFGCL